MVPPKKMPDELASEEGMPRNRIRISRNSRICLSFIGWPGVSAQARWLMINENPCFSDWMRGASATASSGVKPSRFMPVSMWSAAPPRQLVEATKPSHSANSVDELMTGRRLASANAGAVLGRTPSST